MIKAPLGLHSEINLFIARDPYCNCVPLLKRGKRVDQPFSRRRFSLRFTFDPITLPRAGFS